MNLEERAAFATALWDLDAKDAYVLLASTESAHALVREAPALDELPDLVTPWVRARAWTTARRHAPVAPPLSLRALERAVADASARGLVLVEPAAVTWFVTSGSLARAFVFAPRGKKPKLRLDRIQNASIRANGRQLGERAATIEDAAFAALGPEPVSFKEILRRARSEVPASSDDGKKLAAAFLRAWQTSAIEIAQKPMK